MDMLEDRPLPSIDQLLFIGLNGWVVALDRDSGEVAWKCSELKSGYTTLLLDGDRLIASTNGYIFCLDPQTGRVVWSNPLRGYGMGVTSLISARGRSTEDVVVQSAAATSEQASQSTSTTGS
jgi:outer membrane protein assembly factor BamB